MNDRDHPILKWFLCGFDEMVIALARRDPNFLDWIQAVCERTFKDARRKIEMERRMAE